MRGERGTLGSEGGVRCEGGGGVRCGGGGGGREVGLIGRGGGIEGGSSIGLQEGW